MKMLKRGLLGVSLALVNLLTPGSAFFCHDVDGIKIISLGNFLRFPRPPPQLNCCFPVCCRTWVSELKPLAPIHLTPAFTQIPLLLTRFNNYQLQLNDLMVMMLWLQICDTVLLCSIAVHRKNESANVLVFSENCHFAYQWVYIS